MLGRWAQPRICEDGRAEGTHGPGCGEQEAAASWVDKVGRPARRGALRLTPHQPRPPE